MCNIVVTTYFCGCYAGTSRERCNRRRCTVRHYTDQLAYRCYNHSRRYRSSGYDGLGSMEGAVAESDSDDEIKEGSEEAEENGPAGLGLGFPTVD